MRLMMDVLSVLCRCNEIDWAEILPLVLADA
jgi:hypothetical protein